MSNKRVEMHRLQELVRLHRLGTGAREVAKLLSLSPNTERQYRRALQAEGLLAGKDQELPAAGILREAVLRQRPVPASEPPTSSADEWSDRIIKLMEAGLGPRAIYDRMRLEEQSFEASYWAVKRFVRRIRKAKGVRAEDVAIIVDTAAGEVAQVDFGYVGKLLDPERHVLRRAWVFVMVLGHSRHMFCKVVFDQKTTTWLRLHVEAFAHFGGTVKVVVPDNLKAAVIRHAFGIGAGTELNRSYRELARHYGFKIDPTPPYSPKKKGKVESAVKYVKTNALSGRGGEDITVVNAALARWVTEIAGTRIHGTTFKQPLVAFEQEERQALLPLPAQRFEEVVWKKALVHQDTHVQFGAKLYSVPWRFIGKKVWLRCSDNSVLAFYEDMRIATHPRHFSGRRSTKKEHLPEHRRELAHRSESYWQARAADIGPTTGELVTDVLEQDASLSHLRDAQAIVCYLEGFPPSRAEAASKRALYFGIRRYREIKSILTKALDFEPLPTVTTAPTLVARTHARNLRELLDAAVEANHEPH